MSDEAIPNSTGDCFVGTPALAGGARESALLATT